jgi:glucosamine-6-phosphate deaminase
MNSITPEELFEWCKIPFSELENHPNLKIPFRICENSVEMGKIMADELVHEIKKNNIIGKKTRAIIPCGPNCWYENFTSLINQRISV